MKTKKSFQDNRSGMTLVVVMVMTLLCAAAASSVLYTVGVRMHRGYKQVHLEQAFYIAEAGMERAAAWVAADNEDSTTLRGNVGGGNYVTVVTVTQLSGGEIGIVVVSTGTINGTSRTVTVRGLQRLSWARYALWYDQQALDLSIAGNDSFRGRFYSRPLMKFIKDGGHAHFYDRAWTVQDRIVDNGAAPIFDYGLVLNAEVQNISEVNFAALKTAASTSGLLLEGDATIEMNGKTMKITNRPRGWNNYVYTIPENGLVYVKASNYKIYTYKKNGSIDTTTSYNDPGDVSVSGPNGLDGKATIVAERDINIIGHVRYADNPKTNPNSNDKLGLIAGRSAVVTKAAPNNVDIYAHIFCRDGGFGVTGYNTDSHRGYLNVYGGIANLIRNAVGQGSSGYWKNYIYDSRFARDPPPYYPRLTDVLTWDGWEG